MFLQTWEKTHSSPSTGPGKTGKLLTRNKQLGKDLNTSITTTATSATRSVPPRHIAILTADPCLHTAQVVFSLWPLVSAQQVVIQEAHRSSVPYRVRPPGHQRPCQKRTLTECSPSPTSSCAYSRLREHSAQGPCGNASVPSTAWRTAAAWHSGHPRRHPPDRTQRLGRYLGGRWAACNPGASVGPGRKQLQVFEDRTLSENLLQFRG